MPLEKAYYWPCWLLNSCPLAERISKNNTNTRIIREFSWAQLCLWRALNIYDDFLDEEARPADLPQANFYFRNFLKTFYQAKLPDSLVKLAEKSLLDLEKCNKEEALQTEKQKNRGLIITTTLMKKKSTSLSRSQSACSLPLIDAGRLSAKSLPLAIAPVALCVKLLPSLTTKQQKGLFNFFRNALAAKQLADDTLDWEEDLLAQRLTPVTGSIIIDARGQKNNLNTYRLVFIKKTASKAANSIINLCQLARAEAKKVGIKDNALILNNIITPLERAANKSLKLQKDVSNYA